MEADPARTSEETARAAFAAINAHDPDALVLCGHPEHYADELLALGRTVRGREGVRQFFVELITAVPDVHMAVDKVVATADLAVVTWRLTGAFSGGPFAGFRATGSRIDLKGCDVMEIRDGLIGHNTIYYDGAAFARQIGMLPKQDSSMDRAFKAAFNAMAPLVRRRSR